MSDAKVIDDIIVRPQPDGKVLYDIPVPKPEVMQEVKIVINRGKGEEVHTEKG